MQDAYTVGDLILADRLSSHSAHDVARETPLADAPAGGAPKEIEDGLRHGGVVDLDRWGRIDQAERGKGKALGKAREKFVRVEDMLAV